MKRGLQHEASMLYSSAHAVFLPRAEEHQAQPAKAGDYKLEAGERVTFSYRIILHEGDAAAAKIADRYAEYVGK